ncbi:MAG TPA: M15 family metallopeptidase [Bacillota bacterium]|nr:M15 family metallopeptidase [Bacillota bacterium]
MDQKRRTPTYSYRPAPPPHKNPALYKTMLKKEIWATAGALVVAVLLISFFWTHHIDKKAADTAAKNTTPTQQTTSASTFDKSKYSLTDPASIWVIVNKKHILNPKDYVPSDLVTPSLALRVPGNESMQMRKATADALTQLFDGAKTAGFNLMVASGYRSYTYQVNLYGGYVSSIGQTEADKTSARPGYSEHQTGLAVDVEATTRNCELDACFGATPEGKWVAENAYKYGFIIRYTEDKVGVTGYDFEPWHLRYVGADLATEMHSKGIKTLEEFFNVPGGDYAKQ